MKSLCKIRDIQKALEDFELTFEKKFGLNLKEGMLLCSIDKEGCNATDLASKIDLTCSNCSKIINSVERKGLIERTIGKNDRRNMCFTLTEKGKKKLQEIQKQDYDIPDLLV